MVLEGDGIVTEYPGGYDDWLSQRKTEVKELQPKAKEHSEEEIVRKAPPTETLPLKKKKNWPLCRKKIESLKGAGRTLHAHVGCGIFKKTPDEMSEAKTKLKTIEDELLSVYERWEYLEELREKLQ